MAQRRRGAEPRRGAHLHCVHVVRGAFRSSDSNLHEQKTCNGEDYCHIFSMPPSGSARSPPRTASCGSDA